MNKRNMELRMHVGPEAEIGECCRCIEQNREVLIQPVRNLFYPVDNYYLCNSCWTFLKETEPSKETTITNNFYEGLDRLLLRN